VSPLVTVAVKVTGVPLFEGEPEDAILIAGVVALDVYVAEPDTGLKTMTYVGPVSVSGSPDCHPEGGQYVPPGDAKYTESALHD
jgi:hypothetical protein